MDRLTMMEAFVRVVDAGSFSAAARTWGRSKAVVSKYVAGLEAHLGAELLRRTTRSLRLTPAGKEYHARCVELLGELEGMEASLADESVALRGTLRISAPPGFVARYLDTMTTEFADKHPRVKLDLHLTHRMVDLVEEGIDVAIRLTEPTDSALVARRIAPAPIVLVAAPKYLAANGRPKRPKDLSDHSCLVDTNFRDQHRWRFVVNGRMTTVVVDGPFRVNSPTVVRDLAVAGRGVALVPKSIAEQALEAGELVELLPGKVALDWSVYAVHPRRKYVPGRVRAYIDHLVAALDLNCVATVDFARTKANARSPTKRR